MLNSMIAFQRLALNDGPAFPVRAARGRARTPVSPPNLHGADPAHNPSPQRIRVALVLGDLSRITFEAARARLHSSPSLFEHGIAQHPAQPLLPVLDVLLEHQVLLL